MNPSRPAWITHLEWLTLVFIAAMLSGCGQDLQPPPTHPWAPAGTPRFALLRPLPPGQGVAYIFNDEPERRDWDGQDYNSGATLRLDLFTGTEAVQTLTSAGDRHPTTLGIRRPLVTLRKGWYYPLAGPAGRRPLLIHYAIRIPAGHWQSYLYGYHRLEVPFEAGRAVYLRIRRAEGDGIRVDRVEALPALRFLSKCYLGRAEEIPPPQGLP